MRRVWVCRDRYHFNGASMPIFFKIFLRQHYHPGDIMPSLEETLLVFTDLDGTLLDFHTLDWQPAAPGWKS